MRKRRKSNLYLILTLLIVVLGIASFCMIFLNVLKTGDSDSYTYYKGLDCVFGKETTVLGQKITLKFSILGFLGFVLPLVSSVLVLVLANQRNKLKFLISAILFLVSAILLFIMPEYTKIYYDTFIGSGSIDGSFSLAIGSILAGSFSSLACLISIVAYLYK